MGVAARLRVSFQGRIAVHIFEGSSIINYKIHK
jgi:hypothetical protein